MPFLRCFALLFLLVAPLGLGAAAPFAAEPFPQRRADRYTTAQGLPAGAVSAVEVRDGLPRVRTAAGAAVFRDGRWQAAPPAEGPRAAYAPSELRGLPDGARVLHGLRAAGVGEWVVTTGGAFQRAEGRWRRVSFPRRYLTRQREVNIDAFLTCVARDEAGVLWFGSSVGLFATDGADYWNVVDREDGLPFEEITCLLLGPGDEIWAGTTRGVCRFENGGWQYWAGPRWLPNDRVNALAADPAGGVWVATDGGVARLADRPTTLAEKAAHYQEITDSRHNRRGYVTGSRLRRPGDPGGGVVYEASDNDGLWTAMYVGAQAFRYAATRDPAAREAARKSMRAMLELVRLTGIKGFPARAVVTKGELARGETEGYSADETVRVEGEKDKIWFQSPVDPEVLCKGDTSSDELDGHYFAWLVYHDLVADAAEKREIAGVVAAVTDNLLEHDLTLVGHTGRATRWGIYHPKFINDDPDWWEERGLNSLSILSYLKIAEHIAGHPRYAARYRELVEKHHYLLNTVTQKVASPWWDVNHSDDEMAFLMYYAILRLEKSPAHRRILLQSLERSWQIERPEASPFFNFVYGALTGRPCDREASVTALQDWPWELIEWETRAYHRHDVTLLQRRGEGRASSQLTRALSPAERRLMRWNGNPYQPEGGTADGRSEEDGSAWLLPYWLGRYHGLIRDAPP
jgi:hypothetical protein